MQTVIQDIMTFFDFTSTTYFALFLGIVGIAILWFRR